MVGSITFKTAHDAQLNDAGKAERARLARPGRILSVALPALALIVFAIALIPAIKYGVNTVISINGAGLSGVGASVWGGIALLPMAGYGNMIGRLLAEKALDKEVPSNMIQGQVNV